MTANEIEKYVIQIANSCGAKNVKVTVNEYNGKISHVSLNCVIEYLDKIGTRCPASVNPSFIYENGRFKYDADYGRFEGALGSAERYLGRTIESRLNSFIS